MIVDLFLGFNEVELAEFRIKYLGGLISHVVIGESDLTHSGKQKDLYFQKWWEGLPKKEQAYVTIVTIPLAHLNQAWDREIYSREFLANYARKRFPGWKFVLSDLDEIPSRDQVALVLKKLGVFHFSTPTAYRRINWKLTDNHKNWARGVCGDLLSLTYPNGGRFSQLPNIGGMPGVHLSYLGLTVENLVTKLSSFAHTEINSDSFKAEDFLSFCDRYRIDHLGRVRNSGFGLLKIESTDTEDLNSSLKWAFAHLFDDGSEKIPNRLSRILASGRLSVYLRKNQNKLVGDSSGPFHNYISSPTVYIWAGVEIFIALLYSAKRCGVLLMGKDS